MDINYVRQLAEMDMQLTRFGKIEEETKETIVIEFGAGKDWFP